MRHSLAGALRRARLAKQASCRGQHGRTVVSFIQNGESDPATLLKRGDFEHEPTARKTIRSSQVV